MFQRRPRRYYGESPRQSWKGALGLLLFAVVIAGGVLGWQEVRQRSALPLLRRPWIVAVPTPVVRQATGLPVSPMPQQAVATAPSPQGTEYQMCPPDCAAPQRYLLELVNRDRTANGLAALAFSQEATLAAQRHAEDMLQRNYFAHDSPEGADFVRRLTLAGAGELRAGGENIWTYKSGSTNGVTDAITDWGAMVELAESSWMQSPGHRANILNGDFTHLGLGIAYDAEKGEVRMVQVFVTPFAP